VTGGASGLGFAIAKRLAEDGARVVITDIQHEQGKAAAVEGGFAFIKQDVCDERHWPEVISEVEHNCGGLHFLINNAGVLGPRDAADPETTRLADWRRIFAVNVESVFLGCRAAIPAIHRSGGGSIVNMSSVAGLTATPFATAYGASKAAVRQLTQSVAQYCAEHKLRVRCNSLHPGTVLTPLWLQHARETAQQLNIAVSAVIEEARLTTPLGELTRAEDVAAAVAFIVSDDARQITGEKLVVDGGYTHCDTYRPSIATS